MDTDRRPERPTIGFLTHGISDNYSTPLWNGVLGAARALDVNLITFPGAYLGRPGNAPPENILYDLVGTDNVEGLVISGGPMSNTIGVEGMKAYCQQRWPSLPQAFIAVVPDGCAGVRVDNMSGIEAAMRHLIEVHGRRRVAFLLGPKNNLEAEARYRAYAQMLQAHDLPLDPELVSPPSDFGVPTVHNWLKVVLEQGLRFDAIMASADPMAFSAIEVLRQFGLAVPDDVALIGFNNELRTRGSTPPLTTVHQPVYRQAYRALEMVVAQLRGEPIVQVETLPTELVIRQSCGCLPQSVHRAKVQLSSPPDSSPLTVAATLNEIEQALIASNLGLPESIWRQQLVSAFFAELHEGAAGLFLVIFAAILREVLTRRGDMLVWQDVLAAMRRAVLPHLVESPLRSQAEDLWQQGQALIAEMTLALEIALKNDALDIDEQWRVISYRLITTFNVEKLMDILLERLPALGIKGCYIVLYEAGKTVPGEWSRLAMAYDELEQVNLVAEGGRRFPTQRLLPPEKWRVPTRYAFVVSPLYFQQSHIGLLIFDVGDNREAAIFNILRNQLSGALMGAGLLWEQQHLEQAATQRAAELEVASHALHENQEKLLITEKMASLSRLTAGIAHEMNTPLAAARTTLAALNRLVVEYQSSIGDAQVTAEDHAAIAEEMNQALDSASRTTEQALSFLRGIQYQSSDTASAPPQYFDVARLIRETLVVLDHASIKSKCQINFELGAENLQLYGAPGRLAQVITNLVMNAIEASAPRGGGPIALRLLRGKDSFQIEVKDQGVGIAAEHLPKIFDPMFTTKPFGEATGLGLTLVHEIVTSDFAGTIQVTSRAGHGTTFILTFPLKPA